MKPILHEENLLVPEFSLYDCHLKNGIWKGLFNRSNLSRFGQSIITDKISSRLKLFSQQEFPVLIKNLSLSKGKT